MAFPSTRKPNVSFDGDLKAGIRAIRHRRKDKGGEPQPAPAAL
jgi:hypothetical protein